MIIKEKKHTVERRGDMLIWLLACLLMFWIVFVGFITQVR